MNKKKEKVLDQMGRRDFVKAFTAGVVATQYPESSENVVTDATPGITTGKSENVDVDGKPKVSDGKIAIEDLKNNAVNAFAKFIELEVNLGNCSEEQGTEKINVFKKEIEKIDDARILLSFRDTYSKMLTATMSQPENARKLERLSPKYSNWG